MSQTKAQLFDVSVEGPTALKNGAFDVTLGAGGNVTISNGNLVLASGSGIDFSATADGSGTVTSELLDDYEEGTWTPEYRPETGSFGSITYDTDVYGAYTKIGRLVHIHGFIRTDALSIGTASGNLELHGLPFPAAVSGKGSNATGSIGNSGTFLGEAPTGLLMSGSGNYINLYYRNAADGTSNISNVTDLNTGVNDNQIFFSLTYFTA